MDSPQQPTVAVRGEAELDVEPDLAVVHLTVQAQDKDRGRTVRLLAQRLDAARALLAGYGDAVERTESGAVWVNPERPGSKRAVEKVTSYRGSAQLHVTVVDFEVLGELVGALAGLEQATVAGPRWELRRDNPAYRQARTEAVEAAVERARQYAAALGSGLTGLLSLADQGLGGADPYPAPGGAQTRGAVVYGYAQESPELDLQPARQTVRATVEARFTLRPPDLS
ncbi:SIMPL domain-containing protein [Kitasatospora sp. NPDC048540]|uniref:SIMPL domain-containing protein n=1 Tax=unclassified Kitasatospora TaxID=2633591 RepID=UPI00053B127C|nr:SIMPL domain-containing protein [Kitasatospora sp. MBT63]